MSPSHNWIRRLRITNGGYLADLDIELAPGGNVICGGPGVGKSTVLEIIRYVLALPVPAHRKTRSRSSSRRTSGRRARTSRS